MSVEHDSRPTGHVSVDDQIGGYSEDTAGGNVDEQRAGETAYPGDETDFADEHMRPTFSDELSDQPGMQPDEDTPHSLEGME